MFRKILIVLTIISVKFKQLFKSWKNSDYVLIIKPDAIGDYVLFRNFLLEIKSSVRYQSCKIVLVGNVIWKDLALSIDGDVIFDFIPVNYNTINKDWFFLIKNVDRYKYQSVITYHYSRFVVTELVAFVAKAKRKITMKGNTERLNPFFKFVTDRFYNQLVQIPSNIKEEFFINKHFAQIITGKSIDLELPLLPKRQTNTFLNTETGYVIFAIGASVKKRQITVATAAEVVKFILSRNYRVYLIGSKADVSVNNLIKSELSAYHLNNLIDLTGQTDLLELPSVIDQSICMVCCESAAFHMSVALQKPTLCISGGGHFQRFVSYAESSSVIISNYVMPCFNCNWNCVFQTSVQEPYPCVDNVTTTKIFEDFVKLEPLFHS